VIASQKQFSVWWIVAPVAAILGFAAMACLGVWLATMSWRAEIVEMRATVAQLEAKGGRAKLSTCEGKQCVAIELLPEGKVYGSKKDPYLVLRY
jgi:hypothetical protein